MTSQERITFKNFVSSLNKDELKEYCESYGVNKSNIKNARNLNFYKSHLINAMEKEYNKDSMPIKSFIKSFAPTLSHDTIIKIYPNYDNYKQEMKIKKEQQKFNKENQ